MGKDFQYATKDYTYHSKHSCHIKITILLCFWYYLKQYFHGGINLCSHRLLTRNSLLSPFIFKWLVASRFFPHFLFAQGSVPYCSCSSKKKQHLGFEKSKYCKNKGMKDGFYFSADYCSVVGLSFAHKCTWQIKHAERACLSLSEVSMEWQN